jgi:hypothetical protein
MNDETTDEAIDTTSDPGPDAWKTAKIVGTEEEAAMAAGFLNSNGIEAQVESLHASEFPTDFGHLGEVHLKVPTERLAEAQQLLEQVEAETALPAVEGEDQGEGE